MKYLVLVIALGLSAFALAGQSHRKVTHPASWEVHHRDGSVTIARRRTESWKVRAYTDKNGVRHKAHADHGFPTKAKG